MTQIIQRWLWPTCWLLVGALAGGVAVAMVEAASAIKYLNENVGAITAAFTVVLAISTIGLWTATHRLWEASERQIGVAVQAADAATKSAMSSGEAVALAERTSQSQLRAYVTISEHKVESCELAVGVKMIPWVTVKNRGLTPANNLRVRIMARFVTPHESATVVLPEDIPAEPFSLAPTEETNITDDDVPLLDEQLIAELKEGTKKLTVLCQADYQDVFGNHCRTRMRASTYPDTAPNADGTQYLWWHGDDNDMT